jgi:hypothetical protein
MSLITSGHFYLGETGHYYLGLTFADGTTPFTALNQRIIPNEKATQYLITLPNRSRLADYMLVRMPKFYYKRVARNLGMEKSINLADPDIEQILNRQIGLQQPKNNAAYTQGAKYLRELVMAIRSRGGDVVFVAMPTSGMIRKIDEKRYPRTAFLDILKKETGSRLINSADEPSLQLFTCPDGSHLDFRDRTGFTSALARLLGVIPQSNT